MKYKAAKGFTLIELLIYITLVAGILLLATSFAWNIINSRTKSFAVQEVEGNARFIMDKIVQITRQANNITAPTLGNSGNQMILVMKDALNNPTAFSLNSGRLQLQRAGRPAVDLNSNQIAVKAVTFKNMSSPNSKTKNIKVNLTLEHLNPDNRPEWNFSDSFETTIEIRDR